MAKQRKTPNQIAFEREVKRLEKIVKIAEAQGIKFIHSPIPKWDKITKKRLSLIKAIKAPDIYEKGTKIDATTQTPVELKSKSSKPEQFTPFTTKIRSKKEKKSKQRTNKNNSRSEAAKKAQETIKRKMREDPEYRKRMEEIRKKAGKKAAETRRKNREKQNEIKQESTQVEPKQEPIKTEPEKKAEPKDDGFDTTDINKEQTKDEYEPQQQYDYDYNPPGQTYTILNQIYNILSSANNANVCDYILGLLEEEIDSYNVYETDELGKQIVAERLENADADAIESANGAAYEPSDNEKLMNYAYRLVSLIYDRMNVPEGVARRIEELAFEDIPFVRKSRSYGNRYKFGI